MTSLSQIDPDIIDHGELAAGGDAGGDNPYLMVPVLTPLRPLRRGRPSLDDDARQLRYFFCAWSLRAFHMARALGRNSPEAHAMLDRHVTSMTAVSAMTIGRKVCQDIMGVEAEAYGKRIQQQMKALCAERGQEHAEAVLVDALDLFGHLDHACKRALGLKTRIYNACHGPAPSDDAFGAALSPLASEDHFPLPVAARMSLMTGVNMAWLWQDQWYYRYVLQAATALRNWTRGEDAELSLAEYYILYRCALSANPDDDTQHGWVKCFLARQVEAFHAPREHFLTQAEGYLREVGLLPRPRTVARMFQGLFPERPRHPRTVTELLRRCEAVSNDNGGAPLILLTPRPLG